MAKRNFNRDEIRDQFPRVRDHERDFERIFERDREDYYDRTQKRAYPEEDRTYGSYYRQNFDYDEGQRALKDYERYFSNNYDYTQGWPRDQERFYDLPYGMRQEEERERQRLLRDPNYDTFYEQEAENYVYEEDFAEQEQWSVPGPYVGMGPGSYQRSDERILEDVNDRLTQHGKIDARQITVEVENGEVSLNGMVNNRHEKRLAENIADSVRGVRDVHNRLRINRNRQEPADMGAARAGTPRGGERTGSNRTGGEIHRGMEVISSDGSRIGKIQDLRADSFLLERGENSPDLLVPFSAVTSSARQVKINVKHSELEQQGWKKG